MNCQGRSDHQAELFEKYQEGKGTVYTLALAGAIPRLSGSQGQSSRSAIQRLTRMTAATLREQTQGRRSGNSPGRRTGLRMKDDKSHVADLIPLLEDREPLVWPGRPCRPQELDGKDFGPEANASRQDTANAVAA